jgi:3-hydroxybutyryl-CoA dehydrogenase
MNPRNIAVLGGGTMGNGIAQVFAQCGHQVTLRDLDQAILDKAIKDIDKSLSKLAEKGKIGASEKDAALGRIARTTDLGPGATDWRPSTRSWRPRPRSSGSWTV